MEKMLRVITILLFFTGVLVSSLDMVRLGDKCYYFNAAKHENRNKRLNWTSAQQFCRSHGMQLASVETQRENDLIVEYIRGILAVFEGRFRVWGFWLGGSDSEQEGTWRWTSGQTLNFTDWGEGEPDSEDGEQDCLGMEVWMDEKQHWKDYSCSLNASFLCELEDVCP